MATGIGTLGEHSLHASLKDWYALPGDRMECKTDGYVIDIIRDNLLIEIQTRHFSAIKRKLKKLVDSHPVRLVYPVAENKWIIRLAANEEIPLDRRKSPKSGTIYDLFSELVYIPDLIGHENLSIEVLLVDLEEVRIKDGRGSWRRRGWSIHDTRLITVNTRHLFESPEDFLALIPDEISDTFTTDDLSGVCGIRKRLAQQVAYSLRHMGVIDHVGKRSRSYLYKISPGG
nr:hypothetical protein [Anaerolineae bacterium]